MSNLAVGHSTVSYGGMSRIPRPFAQSQPALPSIQPRHGDMDSTAAASRKMSRLEQLQANFQTQLLKQKEEKMINLYQENQQRALQKVNQKRGFARDFFEERRNIGSGKQIDGALNPSMDQIYRRKKTEYEQNAFGYQGLNTSKQVHNNRIMNGSVGKTSAGKDRSNLLAPISRTNSGNNPIHNRAKLVRPKTFTGQNRSAMVNEEYVPRSAPNGNDKFNSDNSGEDTPPVSAKKLQNLQQRRKILQNQQINKTNQINAGPKKEGELTDFQKWRMEQDRNRELRLQKQRERIGTIRTPPEDEGYEEEEGLQAESQETPVVDDSEQKRNDEIKMKQQELLAQIEAQQQELERLRKEREKEEQEEAKQKEKRAKMERERKRQMEEAEKERQRQEDEDAARQRREAEAARARRAETERLKQKSRPPSKHQYEYEESDPEDNPVGHQNRTPAPPAGPKPATKRRPPPQHHVKATPPPARDSPSPAIQGGNHVAFYEEAIQGDSEAFGDTGRLKACYNCGRKFAEDRLEKHEKACKNATKKRKVMDPRKLRTAGTDMEQFVQRMPDKPKPKKKNNWRAQHESFVEAIRYAKKVTQIEASGGSAADLPPPPRSENPDYVQCPYCSRRFNQNAAERHIPHCKNTKARPAPLKKR